MLDQLASSHKQAKYKYSTKTHKGFEVLRSGQSYGVAGWMLIFNSDSNTLCFLRHQCQDSRDGVGKVLFMPGLRPAETSFGTLQPNNIAAVGCGSCAVNWHDMLQRQNRLPTKEHANNLS